MTNGQVGEGRGPGGPQLPDELSALLGNLAACEQLVTLLPKRVPFGEKAITFILYRLELGLRAIGAATYGR